MPRVLVLGAGLLAAGVVLVAGATIRNLPSLAAGALLHPIKRPLITERPAGCVAAVFSGASVRLDGWRCPADRPARGTIVFLHGVADNRGSGSGVIRRLGGLGLNIVAYDSRAHGRSEGRFCTYGYVEKDDLKRVIDGLSPPVILIGVSMGAAVALQAAAVEPRIAGVVAAETFSDLATVARERTRFFLPKAVADRALRMAEEGGSFHIAAVSPASAARDIRVPVLLIHGADDWRTSPDHSRRVFAALAGPKKLLLVDGAGHNGSLRDEGVWQEIRTWIEKCLADGRSEPAGTIAPGAHDQRTQGSGRGGSGSRADSRRGSGARAPRAGDDKPTAAPADPST